MLKLSDDATSFPREKNSTSKLAIKTIAGENKIFNNLTISNNEYYICNIVTYNYVLLC